MAAVVPIYNEVNSFIGVWAQNRGFTPSRGALAELMSLAEPALAALTKIPYKRTENRGAVRVGSNVSFQDGVFLMIDGESAPTAEIEGGGSFVAIAYHGIPIVKRVTKGLPTSKTQRKWWKFWEFLRSPQPTDDDLKKIQVGMTVAQVLQTAGRCKNFTTMGSALGQLKGFVGSGDSIASMSSTELWVYFTNKGKYKIFVTNGVVDEVKFEGKS